MGLIIEKMVEIYCKTGNKNGTSTKITNFESKITKDEVNTQLMNKIF